MRMRYFGDSYDVIKRYLLHTIDSKGDWAAFPMFTERVKHQAIAELEAFLGVRVIRPGVVPVGAGRRKYFTIPSHEHRLLVDPTTGIRLKALMGAKARDFVVARELVELSAGVRERLLIVFDQSHPRGAERKSLRRKLHALERRGVYGFAYRSHASFLVLSTSKRELTAAWDRLRGSGLPKKQLVKGRSLLETNRRLGREGS